MKLHEQPVGDKNIVGQKIKMERKNMGLKQKDFLAQLQVNGLDLSVSSLSKIEGQSRAVTDKELCAIADTLDLTTDSLLNRGDF